MSSGTQANASRTMGNGDEVLEFGQLVLLGQRHGYLAVLSGAYVDDSGSPESGTAFILSAFYTTPKDWQKLIREWMSIVHQSKVTAFHATDCANGAGEFTGWSNKKKKKLFTNLINILSRHSNLRGCSAGVALQDYRDTVYPEADELFGGSRGLVFQLLLEQLGKRVEWPVAVIMDKPPKGWGKLDEIFDGVKALPVRWAKHFHSLTPGSAQTFPGIQTADLLAYETYRHLNKMLHGEVQRKIRKSLLRLVLEKSPVGAYFNKESLLTLIAECKKSGKLSS